MAGPAHPCVVVRVVVAAGEIGPVVGLRWVGRATPIAARRLAASLLNPQVACLITGSIAFPGMVGRAGLVTLRGDAGGDLMAAHDFEDQLLGKGKSLRYLALGVTGVVPMAYLFDQLRGVRLRLGAASYAAHSAPPMPENRDRTFMTPRWRFGAGGSIRP